MSNGTSDGEEHSTQDSDSQTSGSSSKQAALTRALELLPTAQAVKDQEEETLNVSQHGQGLGQSSQSGTIVTVWGVDYPSSLLQQQKSGGKINKTDDVIAPHPCGFVE